MMNIIREKRLALGMAQKQLAEIIGCSRRAVWAWERDVYRPTALYLVKLAEILRCGPAELPQAHKSGYQRASDIKPEREQLNREKVLPYKERRLTLGLTQKELAQKVGVSRATINNIERGINYPRWETRQKIRRALGMPEERYFTAEERNAVFLGLQQQGVIDWAIRNNMPLLRNYRSDLDDLYQSLAICAIRAIDRYNPDYGANVTTYVENCILWGIKYWITRHKRHGLTGKEPFPFQVVSLDAMTEAGFDIPG